MEKIKVGAVSYLNTKPLLYGIRRSDKLMDMIELIEEYPSRIADKLVDGTLDVALVPVATIPRLPAWHIVSDYCIGADGPVASVCMFSEKPVTEVETVLLDYQSRTSVRLCELLLRDFWKVRPQLQQARENYIECIKGTTAGVVIGDRALAQRAHSTFRYDLAEAWKEMTGLPFVFAAWIANKKLPVDFIHLFNHANGIGLSNLDAVIRENDFKQYDLNRYFRENISYALNEEKLKGMKLFLDLLNEIK